jgi:hypothetical protein
VSVTVGSGVRVRVRACVQGGAALLVPSSAHRGQIPHKLAPGSVVSQPAILEALHRGSPLHSLLTQLVRDLWSRKGATGATADALRADQTTDVQR